MNAALVPAAIGVVAASPAMRELLKVTGRLAEAKTAVLVQGESGTGKDLLAQAIHRLSPRCNAEFVPFNCGSGTAELLDAELFGHVKGSFTGAITNRAGLVRKAAGGTLFLDEIAELTLELQPRLLRLLDTGEVRPVGSDETEQVDVRMISATHQDLESRVAGGLFRRDLYYRLSGMRLRMPPLRERLEDLDLLVDHFAAEARRKGRPGFLGVNNDVLQRMAAYSWPGNLRELRNALFRLAGRTPPGEEALAWEPDADPAMREGVTVPRVGLIDRTRLEAELHLARGNVAVVAERLGLSRAKLYRLFHQFGLRPAGFRR